jgi:polynucleotide 5'-kinase involved in rRNA processing
MFFKKKICEVPKVQEISKEDIIKEYKEKRTKVNYPIGSKVIIRSNENEPYEIGNIVDYVNITKARNLFPVISVNEKNFICLGIIRHYSKEICNILDKLTPKEQWNILSEFNTLLID